MTLRRKPSPNPDAELLEGAPGIDETWVKRWVRGRARTVGYLLLGTLAVAAGAPGGIGPFAWLASAQGAILGTASPIVSAVIAYAVLAMPLVWLLRRPSGATTPLLLGAQHAFDPKRRPCFVASAPRRLREARACRAGSLAIAALAVLGGAAGWLLSQRPAANVGRPLPVLTGAQAIAAAGRARRHSGARPSASQRCALGDQPFRSAGPKGGCARPGPGSLARRGDGAGRSSPLPPCPGARAA